MLIILVQSLLQKLIILIVGSIGRCAIIELNIRVVASCNLDLIDMASDMRQSDTHTYIRVFINY